VSRTKKNKKTIWKKKGAFCLKQDAFFCGLNMDESKEEKTLYRKIIDGDAEPVGSQKGWKNLEKRTSFNEMDPERRREICRKGAEAVNKLHGEKKTAKQSLEKILTLKIDSEIMSAADVPRELADKLRRDNPDATLYDLIQIVAVGRAVGGNIKAAEYIRDTHGDKPIERVEVTDNVTTDADRELMRQLSERLQDGSRLEIVKDLTAETDGTRQNGGGGVSSI
jgi:general stress protein YciG